MPLAAVAVPLMVNCCAAEARCALALLQSCRRHWNQWGIRSSLERIG
jgi:hypothetical protein